MKCGNIFAGISFEREKRSMMSRYIVWGVFVSAVVLCAVASDAWAAFRASATDESVEVSGVSRRLRPEVSAQRPLCIVNGAPTEEDIALIPPEDIERVETLPADEETIARYGAEASNGVILVTLRYDEPARFGWRECRSVSTSPGRFGGMPMSRRRVSSCVIR